MSGESLSGGSDQIGQLIIAHAFKGRTLGFQLLGQNGRDDLEVGVRLFDACLLNGLYTVRDEVGMERAKEILA